MEFSESIMWASLLAWTLKLIIELPFEGIKVFLKFSFRVYSSENKFQ